MTNKPYNIINAALFSAATSLNAFWILIVLKGAYPAISEFMNFHPPTGPLLGLYISAVLIFVLCFLAGWFVFQGRDKARVLLHRYFIGSVIFYVFITLPVFHQPLIHLLK